MEKQIKLTFEPNEHKYSDETGRVYTSVTTLIGQYQEPFNEKYWSMYTALKNAGYNVRPTRDKKHIVVNNRHRTLTSLYKNPINGHEVKLLVKKWQNLTEEACERGNNTHDYLEDSINLSKGDDGSSNTQIEPQLAVAMQRIGLVEIRTKHDLDTTTLQDTFPTIYKRLLAYINFGCVLYAEKRIYTVQFGVAGMIDVLIVKGKQFAILDWKTNKDEMKFTSGYYKKVKINHKWVKSTNWTPFKKHLFTPLNHIQDCKGMLYTLQLSLYAFIMELWGYSLVPNGLEIFHMRPNQEPKLIKVRYLKEDISNMLKHFINKGITTNTKFGIM